MKHWIKGYVQKDGTHVKGRWITTKSTRKSRKRTPKRRYPAKKSRSLISRKGKLGGPGYMSKSPKVRHELLNKCVTKYGYRSCLGSVLVLKHYHSANRKFAPVINSDAKWLKNKYGGKGSFGSRKKSPKKSQRKSKRYPRRAA